MDLQSNASAAFAAFQRLEKDSAQFVSAVVLSEGKHRGEGQINYEEGGPGRGFPKDGTKATYTRTPGRAAAYYERIIDHQYLGMFEMQTGLTRDEFDDLFSLCEPSLSFPMDVRYKFTDLEQQVRAPRRRFVPNHIMLFLFLFIMRAGNEGSVGIETVDVQFGIHPATISNYLRHVSRALLDALSDDPFAEIVWPSAAERREMTGLVYGFPNAICFVDGTKQKVFRPGDSVIQEARWDGHHHMHCFAVLLWTDVYGVIIRLDMTLEGHRHVRRIYNESDPYRMPTLYFSEYQAAIADKGFEGDGHHIIFPLKNRGGDTFPLRGEMNRDIRKQRVRNEWSIGLVSGLVSNRFRLFLGRWPFEPELFPVVYRVAALLVNLRIRRSGTPPVPIDRMLERLELYERGD